MKKIISISLLTFLTSCGEQEIKKIVEDEKLQNDSEAVVEDILELGEEIIRDEIHIPKDKK